MGIKSYYWDCMIVVRRKVNNIAILGLSEKLEVHIISLVPPSEG